MARFTNQATLSYSGGVTTSNVVTGEVVAAFSAGKTAVTEQYAPGETVTYVVSIQNPGDSPLEGVSVSDDLGEYQAEGVAVYPLEYAEGSLLYYLDGVLQPRPAVDAPLEISGLTIPAGSSAMLIYETRVTEYAPLGPDASVTNTAVITAQSAACTAEASATVPALSQVRLTVSKSLCPQEIPCSGEVTYTFRILNTGAAEAGPEESIVLADAFDPVLTGLTAALNGAVQPAQSFYTYDPVSGQFETVPGAITVPAASFVQNQDGTWTTEPGETVVTVTGRIGGENEEIIE